MKKNIINKEGIPTIQVSNPAELAGLRVIDVRGPDEYIGELGHINGAELVTLGEELEAFLNREDKNQDIVFVCRSGMRSGRATEQARALGFKQVFNLEGGMIYWNKMNFPVKL